MTFRQRATSVAVRTADLAGRLLRGLPGILAIAAATAGAYILWGLGVALLVFAVFMILIDRKI